MHEDNLGLFKCSIRTTGSHRHSHVRHRQTRSVIDSVADHGDAFSFCHELSNRLNLSLRLEFGAHVLQTELALKGQRGTWPVACKHHRVNPKILQSIQNWSRLWANVVPQQNPAEQISIGNPNLR